MESFTAIRESTNPYQSQLVEALGDCVTLEFFSWRRALMGRFDILHLHWPEVLIRDRSTWRTTARRLLMLLVLVRIRMTGTAIVRTVHNTSPHERGSWTERALLRLCDRWTTNWIVLNSSTPLAAGARSTVIPHGHYRDWFRQTPVPTRRPGQIAFVGRIRQYKGVDDLIAAFSALPDPELRLSITGLPETASAGTALTQAAAADPRIHVELRHVSDAELATAVGRASLVVLPYRDMHNSGAALLALSLDRPVLVPDNEVTRELAREVGPVWVQRFRGHLDSATLRAALDAVAARTADQRPDLDARQWPAAASDHLRVFRHAVRR